MQTLIQYSVLFNNIELCFENALNVVKARFVVGFFWIAHTKYTQNSHVTYNCNIDQVSI